MTDTLNLSKLHGEVLGHGHPDWPAHRQTFNERAAYQEGVAHARAVAVTIPIPMVLHCPACGTQHIDAPDAEGHAHAATDGTESRWDNPPHRSHKCNDPTCNHIWRPADVCTTGVFAVSTKGQNDSAIAPPLDRELETLRTAHDELIRSIQS